jgi:hypothetical protein
MKGVKLSTADHHQHGTNVTYIQLSILEVLPSLRRSYDMK